jgi:hypothetical protein
VDGPRGRSSSSRRISSCANHNFQESQPKVFSQVVRPGGSVSERTLTCMIAITDLLRTKPCLPRNSTTRELLPACSQKYRHTQTPRAAQSAQKCYFVGYNSQARRNQWSDGPRLALSRPTLPPCILNRLQILSRYIFACYGDEID